MPAMSDEYRAVLVVERRDDSAPSWEEMRDKLNRHLEAMGWQVRHWGPESTMRRSIGGTMARQALDAALARVEGEQCPTCEGLGALVEDEP